MLPFLTLLLACQLAGEALARVTGLPVPGPILGLVLLFAGLALRGRPAPRLEESADGLLAHLSLLFVPAGVGVVQYLPLLASEWLAVSASVVGGAVVAIAVTGLVMRALSRDPEPVDR
ncbi:CidA/LrgA family protein [Geodermatophilus sp. SYSU D00697]